MHSDGFSLLQVVSSFSKSWYRRRELTKVQKELNLPNHQLIGDVPTRWAAKHAMISRFLENEDAVRRVFSSDRKVSHLMPSWQKIDVLKSVNIALDGLCEFTNSLSGESYTTVSSVLPLLSVFRDLMLEIREKDSSRLTRDIIDNASVYISELYHAKDTKQLLALCSLLDPRYKTDYLDDDEESDISLEQMKILLVKEVSVTTFSLTDEAETAECTVVEVPQTSEFTERSEAAAAKRLSLVDRLKKKQKLAAPLNQCSATHLAQQELDSYLRIPVIDVSEDPLKWWNVNKQIFPVLSEMAKKFLSIPATSTPSERLFSASGNVITSKRNKLNPTTAEKLVFLYQNL